MQFMENQLPAGYRLSVALTLAGELRVTLMPTRRRERFCGDCGTSDRRGIGLMFESCYSRAVR